VCLRQRRGWSAKELSRRAGLSPSYVSKLESGECSASVRTFGAIARALGMTPLEVWVLVLSEALSQPLRTMPEDTRNSSEHGDTA